MGLDGDGIKVESCESKGKKKKKEKEGVEDSGCWIKLRFIGSCISSKSKVDSSISSISTICGNYFIHSEAAAWLVLNYDLNLCTPFSEFLEYCFLFNP